MKTSKRTAFAVMSSLVLALSATSVATATGATTTEGTQDVKARQQANQSKISRDSGGQETITWNMERGVPNFVSGRVSLKKLTTANDALAILEENRDLFTMHSAADELQLITQSTDTLGTRMFKFQQLYQGVPVFGNELIVHSDRNSNATSINGYYDPQVRRSTVDIEPALNADQAITIAKQATGLTQVEHFDLVNTKLYVYAAAAGRYHLIHLVTLSTLEGNNPAYVEVYVDAHSGAVLNTISKMESAAAVGTGTGVLGDTKSVNTDSYSGGYYLRDVSKAMSATGGKIETYTAANKTSLPGTLLSNATNVWTDRAAVDAHVYAGKVYDYYYSKHNRNSFDGNGATMKSTVHYSSNYNNAFWNGVQMVYGDGDGSVFVPLSGALDVVGHEITHAVTERTANLVYQGQSGALNESWSDAMGNLIENKADNNWLVGEDIYTPATAGDALRSMSHPSAYGDPEHMSQFVVTTADNGGVHTNSGIPNKAFYNFVSTPGITRDNAGKVWYRALVQYLTSSAQFIDARTATIQAATDLFGAGSAEVNAVTNAWNNVGVTNTPPPPPQNSGPYEPNDTQATAYGPLTAGTVYSGYIENNADNDWFKISVTAPVNITANLSNLPKDYDLFFYDSSGTLLNKSVYGGTTAESLTYKATASGTYYLKVNGYNGAYSTTSPYSLKVTTQTAQPAQWYYENVKFDTPHPYANNYNNGIQHTYSKIGADKVALHFSRFETERNYDYAYIKDKSGVTKASYSGTQSAFWSIVDGDKITSNFVTDGSVTYFGYTIDQVGYYSSSPLSLGSTTEFADPIRQ